MRTKVLFTFLSAFNMIMFILDVFDYFYKGDWVDLLAAAVCLFSGLWILALNVAIIEMKRHEKEDYRAMLSSWTEES